MDWLRLESLRKRQRHCQSRPVGAGGGVQLRRSASAGVGFAGVQSCGSVMCPHCGSKIAAQRREDVTAGVRTWRENGGIVLFGTMTLRHNRGQSLDMLADAVAECWKYATAGRGWQRDRKEHGIAGFVRVWETTRSGRNGWHQHVHFLLFVEAGQAVHAEALLASMFGRWSRRAAALGLDVPLRVGQDLHQLVGTPDEAADALGAYFAKEAGAGGRLPEQAIGWEVAGGSGKTSLSGATPLQLLDAAIAGDDAARSLWYEYELAMHGRRTIFWSRGMRDLLGLGGELTDEQIAEQEAGDAEDTVVSIPAATWRRIVRDRGRGPLIVFAGDPRHSAEQIVSWCARRGWWVIAGDAPAEDMEAAA